MVAPFWTDLNPPAGGAIRVATLTGGGFSWIVVDWAAVKNFSNATTHSFEIWLQRPAERRHRAGERGDHVSRTART